MRTIFLQPIGASTSRLGLGTGSLHHLVGSRARQNLLAQAFDLDIRYFDTAPLYGHEMAERELGRFLKHRRAEIVLATKFGIEPSWLYTHSSAAMYVALAARRALGKFGARRLPHYVQRDFSVRTTLRRVQRSLQALRTDCIDILLLHEAQLEQIPDVQSLLEALGRLRDSGCVRCFGLAGEAVQCLRICQQWPQFSDWLQVDCAAGPQATRALEQAGFTPQLTFGHFRAHASRHRDAVLCLREAAQINPHGVILFSSRDTQRIRQTVEAMAIADSDLPYSGYD